MTPEQRAHVVRYLEETRAALLDTTRDLTPQQWFQRPAPEAWCAAECVEHLSITERGLLRTIRRLCEAPAASAADLAAAAGKESLIERAVPSRGRRVRGPDASMPRLESTDHAAILARFVEIRAHSIDYARTTSDPIRERLFPHFVFGPLDGYQWMIFMAAHSERHRKQILEAVA